MCISKRKEKKEVIAYLLRFSAKKLWWDFVQVFVNWLGCESGHGRWTWWLNHIAHCPILLFLIFSMCITSFCLIHQKSTFSKQDFSLPHKKRSVFHQIGLFEKALLIFFCIQSSSEVIFKYSFNSQVFILSYMKRWEKEMQRWKVSWCTVLN